MVPTYGAGRIDRMIRFKSFELVAHSVRSNRSRRKKEELCADSFEPEAALRVRRQFYWGVV